MPLIATPGAADANSYLSVAEADAIAAEVGLGRDAAVWDAAEDADKAKALIRATSEVDAYVGFAGVRWATDQALLFPRYYDVNTSLIPYIVSNVRLATFHQAVYDLANANLIADADARRARGLVSFSDDDGSGALGDPQMLSARARWHLRSLKGSGRATLVSVPIASSYASTDQLP
jgi:hypothetical protein